MDDFDNFEKNKKLLRIIFIGIIAFAITLFIIIRIFISANSKKYLIIGNKALLYRKNNIFYQLSYDSNNLEGNFTVYDGKNKLKASKATFSDDKWEFYKGKELLSINDFKIAFSKLKDVKPIYYSASKYDKSDEDLLLNIVNTDDSTDLNIYRTSMKKITYDFDKDNSPETLYTVSNFVFGRGDRVPYSYMYLVKKGQVLDVKQGKNSNVFNVEEILQIDGDINVIISDRVAADHDFNSCYKFYKIKNGKFNLSQDCKIKESD